MIPLTTNLRKAAILIRSVDAETAASLLAQLSPAEAKSIRLAIQSLGSIHVEEQADVAAEFRRVGPLVGEDPRCGVELSVSSTAEIAAGAASEEPPASKPFEFLERARVESLVPYLSREQSQTVAVVLSYLTPRRAADLLAALPAPLQAATVERLSALGDTDPASLQVLERELAEWVERQQATRSRDGRRADAAAAILAAADDEARAGILANLLTVNRELAEQVASSFARRPTVSPTPDATNLSNPLGAHRSPAATDVQADRGDPHRVQPDATGNGPHRHESSGSQPISQPRPQSPQIPFDDLATIDKQILAKVLKAVDANVWALALAGANEAVVERIAGQMSRSAAKTFRRRLRQLGPTRLSDVEAAQREVAAVAAQMLRECIASRSETMAVST